PAPSPCTALFRSHLVGDVEHGHVHTVEHLRGQGLHDDVLTTHAQDLARAACRSHQTDLAPHVRTLGQDAPHDGADSTGRPDAGQGGKPVTHRPGPPYTPASSRSASSWNSL